MTKASITGGALACAFVLLGVAAALRTPERDIGSAAMTAHSATRSTGDAHAGLLYGRVTTDAGDVYEGRLRFGGDEEALWGNQFNGVKKENPWRAHAPDAQLPRKGLSFEVLGIELAVKARPDVGRPFMASFGDIERLEALGRDLWVTLKSGTLVHLDRYAADDFADGVRIWDEARGTVDLQERRIRSIEFLSAPRSGGGPRPLHGTVHARQGSFTGLLQWDREAALGTDRLAGQAPGGKVGFPFAEIRSIARGTDESALVTLHDGREVALSSTRADGRGNRGMYVDDPRYGRVLISWAAFERVDLSPGGTGPAYDDFPPGHALTGTVVTRSGSRLVGRLVYDLDESETTETLDAPWQGVHYTIPFARIASVEILGEGSPTAKVTLFSGEELQLERSGDLAPSNAGVLVFSNAQGSPEYVPWKDVEGIAFDRSPETSPPGGSR